MTNKKYISLELGDSRLKEISEVLGNKTCKKILDLLSEEELTVSDISERLDIPLNTADYNVKKLLKTGLIESKDFFWSLRKKKMPKYSVSNKKILISPKKISRKMAVIISFLTTGLIAYGIKIFNSGRTLVKESAQVFSRESTIQDTAMLAANQTPENIISPASVQPWMWFLMGC